ncbi:hypothetical protein O181_038335 [Austropuccinia psidii MF-1]|uniref:Uncharacterized protein n=1 Tax=Austropuccinia psidii MF-1 TaxID=1389203 RepID=A0A9Q3DCP7_9BASI|nr:hypothetical protein [Austropuccinia psidii MF-1]
MDNKRFNIESHCAELGASFQKICLKEIPFKDLMEITKGWNPTRKFRLLKERETRIRENQATIQAIEEQLNQTEPTLIPSGSQGVDQNISPVASNHSGTNRSVAKSHHSEQSEAERVRPNDPEGVGLGERSTQHPEIAVNTSRISNLTNRNITPTQTGHNNVTPESNLNSDKLWLKISQLEMESQEQLEDFKRINERLQRNATLQEAKIKFIQESCAQLSKASEETNKRLNQVFEEKHH